MPWKRPELTVTGLRYPENGGLPSEDGRANQLLRRDLAFQEATFSQSRYSRHRSVVAYLKVGFWGVFSTHIFKEFVKLMLFIHRFRRDAWFRRSILQAATAIASF